MIYVNSKFPVITGYFDQVDNGVSTGNFAISYTTTPPSISEGDIITLGSLTLRTSTVKTFSDRYELVVSSSLIDLSLPNEPHEFLNPTLNILFTYLYPPGVSPSSTFDLSTIIPRWTFTKSTVQSSLQDLTRNLSLRYSFDHNGLLVISPLDNYPPFTPSNSVYYKVLDDKNETLSLSNLNPQDPFEFSPGFTYLNHKIRSTRTTLNSSTINLTANYSDFTSTLDVQKKVIDQQLSKTLYHYHHNATVVSQNADGSLNVKPENELLPPLSSIPLYLNTPGITVKVDPNILCLLSFRDGNPQYPYVSSFHPSSTASEYVRTTSSKITLDAPHIEVGQGGALFPAADLESAIADINAKFNAVYSALSTLNLMPVAGIGSPLSATIVPYSPLTPSTYVSSKVKISK